MLYKIKDTKTNLYWRGGSANSKFTKHGKTWNALGHLKNAIINKWIYRIPWKKGLSPEKLKEETAGLIVEEYSPERIKTYDLFGFIIDVVIKDSKTYYQCEHCGNIFEYWDMEKSNDGFKFCKECYKFILENKMEV